MIFLGLHFGHDASIALVKDGILVACYEIERIRKVKHAIGIKADEVKDFLRDFGIRPKEVEAIAITTSQGIEFLFDKPEEFSFKYVDDAEDSAHLAAWSKRKAQLLKNNQAYLETNVLKLLAQESPEGHPFFKYLKNGFEKPDAGSWLGTFEDYVEISSPTDSKDLGLLNGYRSLRGQNLENGFQYPVKVNLLGEEITGYVYSHHFAHACYAHFEVSKRSKVIFSHDGSLPSTDYRSGAVYYAKDNQVELIGLHHLSVGKMYEVSSGVIGFSEDSGPGKMMGLAPYGESVFERKKYVGNYYDQLPNNPVNSKTYRKWVESLCDEILEKGVEKKLVSNSSLTDINVNDDPKNPKCLLIAASIQQLTEDTLVHACKHAMNLAEKDGYLGTDKRMMALTGGTALNCPANTQIAKSLPETDIFVPPAVHDGGLSIGAAYYLAYQQEEQQKCKKWYGEQPKPLTGSAYLGKKQINEQEILSEIKQYCNSHKGLEINTQSAISGAAKMLSEQKIIAVFASRGEIGPRALGARSILANPKNGDNWRKVNEIKSRELWRPFAPIVLSGYENDFFELEKNVVSYSYMLFTTQVTVQKIPAVTHVDQSSRVQVLKEEDNKVIHQLMLEFSKLTGIPVLMNTSFNGPKEPVIETVQRAIQFVLETEGLDGILFGDKVLVCKGSK